MIYKVYGGWTTHERYSVDVVAKSEKEAEKSFSLFKSAVASSPIFKSY